MKWFFLHFWKLRFLCKIFQKIFSGNWFLFISQIFLVRTIFYFLTCRMLLLWQQKPISDCTKTNIFLNAQQNCLMTLFWRESSIFSSIYCVVFFSFFILSKKRIVSFLLAGQTFWSSSDCSVIENNSKIHLPFRNKTFLPA